MNQGPDDDWKLSPERREKLWQTFRADESGNESGTTTVTAEKKARSWRWRQVAALAALIPILGSAVILSLTMMWDETDSARIAVTSPLRAAGQREESSRAYSIDTENTPEVVEFDGFVDYSLQSGKRASAGSASIAGLGTTEHFAEDVRRGEAFGRGATAGQSTLSNFGDRDRDLAGVAAMDGADLWAYHSPESAGGFESDEKSLGRAFFKSPAMGFVDRLTESKSELAEAPSRAGRPQSAAPVPQALAAAAFRRTRRSLRGRRPIYGRRLRSRPGACGCHAGAIGGG